MEENLFDKIIEYCLKHPEEKDSYKEIFLPSLHHKLETLIEIKDYQKVFSCFELAQKFFNDDSDVLNVLGVALNRMEKPIEALNYLNKAIQLSPEKIKILDNYENVVNEWIPRWHFSMLNDEQRNTGYKKAISEKIKEGYKTILDIGTGTGLLSLYCYEAGATNIYACESDEIMYNIAKEVFNENSVPVTLIKDHSTNLNSERFGVKGFDLIVTEIFDCGAFGEGILSTLIHAKENLLTENGKILPEKIKLYVAGVGRIGVTKKTNAVDNTLENSIYLKDTFLTPKIDGPYEPIEQICSKMIFVTEPAHAFTVNLNSLENLRDAMDGKLDTEVELSSLDDILLEGFLVYFELYLNNEIILKNFDPLMARNGCVKCWDPVVFPLNQSIRLGKYDIISVTLSCKDGILNVIHDINNTEKKILEIDKQVFSFLADDDYNSELEYNVNKLLEKKTKTIELLADLSPFPNIGINFLKENKIKKLYCSGGSIRELILNIAKWNCIPEKSIVFVNNLHDLVEQTTIKFDLIILQPITADGLLNENHLKYFHSIKENCLQPSGLIFPAKVDLCCKLIYSNWLDTVTHIQNNNADLKKFNIHKYLNQYSTKHQLEYVDFDTINVSELFTMTTLQLDNELHIKEIVINLNSSQEKINGIMYFYKIYFANNSKPISTRRRKSFSKLNCFVQNVNITNKSNLKVQFTQNELAFRCKIIN